LQKKLKKKVAHNQKVRVGEKNLRKRAPLLQSWKKIHTQKKGNGSKEREELRCEKRRGFMEYPEAGGRTMSEGDRHSNTKGKERERESQTFP